MWKKLFCGRNLAFFTITILLLVHTFLKLLIDEVITICQSRNSEALVSTSCIEVLASAIKFKNFNRGELEKKINTLTLTSYHLPEDWERTVDYGQVSLNPEWTSDLEGFLKEYVNRRMQLKTFKSLYFPVTSCYTAQEAQ